jgi:hypothetical protein
MVWYFVDGGGGWDWIDMLMMDNINMNYFQTSIITLLVISAVSHGRLCVTQ